MKKRILAMVMVLMMTVAYLPAMAFAEDNPSGGGMPAGGQQDINQIIKDRQVEFLNMLLPFIQKLKLDEKAGKLDGMTAKLDELKKKITEIQGIMGVIDEASKIPKEEVGTIIDLLKMLKPDLYNQIYLITDFIINIENWAKAKGLNDGEVNEMTVALAEYKTALQTLNATIDVYLKNGNVDDDDARVALINDVNDALTSVGNAQHSLKDSLIDVLTSSANQIKANSQVYVDFLKTQVAKVKAGAAAVTPQIAAKASEALGKLRESMDLLQSIVKVSQPFVTTRVTNAVNQAQEALKAGGTALQNYITTMVQKITKNPGAITDQESSGNGSKGNSAATNSSAITGNSASAYVSQLENAAKIVNIKPSLKSLTSKGKKVSVKWAAVKAGKISYYQVSYQQKGKKAVTKTFKKYKAAAKFITYKSKKLKKGKKYTFKVRGVYKMTAAAAGTKSKAARFYTQWSKSRTIKVK